MSKHPILEFPAFLSFFSFSILCADDISFPELIFFHLALLFVGIFDFFSSCLEVSSLYFPVNVT